MTQEQREKLNAAVRSPYNLLGLSVGVALTAVFLDVRPLAAALALEAIYLAVRVALPAKTSLGAVQAYAAALAPTKPSADAARAAAKQSASPAPPTPAFAAAQDFSATAPISRDFPEVRSQLGAPPFASAANLSREAALPHLRRELQTRYEALESSLQIVKLMSDASLPASREIPVQLDALLGKFLFFAVQEERLRDTLEALRDEARALSAGGGDLLPRAVDGIGMPAGTHLHLSSGASPHDAGDLWLEQVVREAHEYFEREMADLAWRREHSFDPEVNAALERRSRIILRRNKYVDKVAKMLKNTIHTLQLVAKRFEVATTEINERAPERILSDIKAIVLQTESMARTLEDLEPFEDIKESLVA